MKPTVQLLIPRASFCRMEKHRLDHPAAWCHTRPQHGKAQTLGRFRSSTEWSSASAGRGSASIQK
eukprot:9297708-Lingulodinium_polyedra.AAC.1